MSNSITIPMGPKPGYHTATNGVESSAGSYWDGERSNAGISYETTDLGAFVFPGIRFDAEDFDGFADGQAI